MKSSGTVGMKINAENVFPDRQLQIVTVLSNVTLIIYVKGTVHLNNTQPSLVALWNFPNTLLFGITIFHSAGHGTARTYRVYSITALEKSLRGILMIHEGPGRTMEFLVLKS